MSESSMRRSGLKVTAPRQKILNLLTESQQRHMSAEDIYRLLLAQNEDIGLATIYRALQQFEKAGLVIKHQFDSDMAVYELDRGEHHDHLVCVRCGQVKEFVDHIIEQRQQDIAAEAGFTLTDHHLNLYGLCSACAKISAAE